MATTPPQDKTELLRRADALAGATLADIAAAAGVTVPADLRRHKGWTGQLLEQVLGASSGSLAQPDFPHLGVEMKSLPVDRLGRPRESTYVCTVPLEGGCGERWEESWVCRKLQRVLWLPVEAGGPLAERRIGTPLLWSPDTEEAARLRRDWEELMELICLGRLETITARHGEVLQIRPKAANARSLCPAIGPDGEPILTNPRGFYLRAGFTADLLRRHFQLPC